MFPVLLCMQVEHGAIITDKCGVFSGTVCL